MAGAEASPTTRTVSIVAFTDRLAPGMTVTVMAPARSCRLKQSYLSRLLMLTLASHCMVAYLQSGIRGGSMRRWFWPLAIAGGEGVQPVHVKGLDRPWALVGLVGLVLLIPYSIVSITEEIAWAVSE